MRKLLIFPGYVGALLFVLTSGAADATTQTKQPGPLTPELAKEIQKDPYIE
jgi:hypothetical protein